MKQHYLNNIAVEQAKELYLSALRKSGFRYKTEEIPSALSCGRILARAVYAAICSPHYNASAMDGIAVKAEDTYGACESTPLTLTADQYIVVDTGDPIPETADAVIMVEEITESEDGGVKIRTPVFPWQNVRQIGEDICMGDMICPSMTKITPSLCGAFLAGGVTTVSVIKKPVFGIIPTGDEIVSPTSCPEKGEIIEFNSAVFSSMLREWDAESVVYPIVKDKKEQIRAAVEKAKDECDAVLILAGSSAGRDDYTSEILSSLGEVIVHGIAAKPGKPAVLGVIEDRPVVGLPGYPVSGIVVMEEFVKPTVELYYAHGGEKAPTVPAVLTKKLVSSLKYKEYIRVTLGKTDSGFFAVPIAGGAGVITGFTKADGILEIPQNSEGFEAGQQVLVRLLKDEESISRSLIITGSHDPVIDEVADILRLEKRDFKVSSSHVGSMGAISAIRNGQAPMGAIHLLDGDTGRYNESFVRKYFPNGEAVLIKGVGRTQGIMVQKGNPLGITDVKDFSRCRYVNRQRGAGTRLLLDYLLQKEGLDRTKLNGYNNEKFTHTAVAAVIASGSADAGLGIYSAAKMYGLDFIPLCSEEYDFLVDRRYLEHEYVRAFFEVLHSPALRERLEKMGGYTL